MKDRKTERIFDLYLYVSTGQKVIKTQTVQKVVVQYNRTQHTTYCNVDAHANIPAVCVHILCQDADQCTQYTGQQLKAKNNSI